jgi:hypothetical protein
MQVPAVALHALAIAYPQTPLWHCAPCVQAPPLATFPGFVEAAGELSSDEQPPVASAAATARDAIPAKKVFIGGDPSK